ncbi:MAG TPA: polysaccharide deacetylase family protein [Patescibacteria group bacterium]|nr:polysaccharide deacetylase family protein [Patescibacteria group bacterium]
MNFLNIILKNMPNKEEKDNSTSAKNAQSDRMRIFLALDFDYKEDYDNLPNVYEAIGDTPVTFFLSQTRHPEGHYVFPSNVQIGNHSREHAEWYGTELDYRIADLMMNHDWIKEKYGVECKVYRSPHLRYLPDTQEEMVKRGYKPEMECVECPWCQPLVHDHLKVYFSSHHHFGENKCHRKFEEAFQLICEKGKDFTFFLDARHFDTPEKVERLKHIIKIGNDFGTFALL